MDIPSKKWKVFTRSHAFMTFLDIFDGGTDISHWKVSSFVFWWLLEVLQVWNNMKVSKCRQNFHSWEKNQFKYLVLDVSLSETVQVLEPLQMS